MKRTRLVVTGLLLLLYTGCKSHSPGVDRVELFRHPGLQWLSWTSTEREDFVYGYIHGYAHGTGEACLVTDELFEKDKPHMMGHDNVPSTFPSSRCRESVAQYPKIRVSLSTGPDFTPYTNVITEFYTKHPEYRDTPFTQLMEFMTGAKALSADDLYLDMGNPPVAR
jgi:hypothetical protein